jgi:hypothetical protein
MATVLEEYSSERQSFVLCRLWAKGLNAKDIFKEFFSVYGGKCLSLKAFTTEPRISLKDVRK